MSESAQATAILACLTAGGAHPYEIDKVPTTLPPYYTEVTVSRRFGGVDRLTSESGTVSYRVTTRAVAKSVGNARNERRLASAALEYAVLSVGGKQTTPIQFESEEVIGPDEGWFSGLTVWTFTV